MRRLRLSAAVLCALLSLLQAPAVVFATAAAMPSHPHTLTLVSSPAEPVAHHHSHPQSPDIADSQGLAGDISGATVCHSVGCCTGLVAFDIATPASIYLSLGPLDAALTATLVPVSPDPADPPPRLQA